MEKIKQKANPETFNSTLETGVRVVMLLHAAYPLEFDLQRLTSLDYLLVRTELLGGPVNLHPRTPIKTPLTQVRRKLVQNATDLMISRNLVARAVGKSGIKFAAGELSQLFIASIQSPYLVELNIRAKWLSEYFQNFTDKDFETLMTELLDNWISEFKEKDHKIGSTL